MKKLLLIPTMLIALIALGALVAIPASADTPTPTATPGLPPGAYACTRGLSGSFVVSAGSYDIHDMSDDISGVHAVPWSSWQEFGTYGGHVALDWALSEPVWVNTAGDMIVVAASSPNTHPTLTFFGPTWHQTTFPGDGTYGSVASGSYSPIGDIGSYYREVDYVQTDFYNAYFNIGGASVNGYCAPTASPTPTATIGPATATPFALLESNCIAATLSSDPTANPTPTPYGLTTTPLSISPTPGPTGTPQPVAASLNYSSTANFATGLQPWTSGPAWAVGGGLPTIHSTITGTDGLPGVAQIGAPNEYVTYSGWSGSYGYMGIHDPIINYTGMETEMLIFPLPQLIDRGINITGKVRSLNPVGHSGNHIWLMFWYLDPGISVSTGGTSTPPEQTWILKPAFTEVSYTWGTFAQRIAPDEDLLGDRAHEAAAIALTWYVTADSDANTAYDILNNAVLVDDINISIGDLPDAALPRCPGAGGAAGPVRPGRVCAISVKTIDVLSICKTPIDIVDIGGWMGWIWCRVSAYFTWVDANRQQVQSMQDGQNEVEPFGSVTDLVSVSAIVTGKLNALQAQNKSNGVPPYDFANMMDTSALGKPIHLMVVTSTSYAYIAQCPSDLITQNNDVLHGACMSVYFLRATPAVQIVQWGLNGFFVLMLIFIIIRILQTLGAH